MTKITEYKGRKYNTYRQHADCCVVLGRWTSIAICLIERDGWDALEPKTEGLTGDWLFLIPTHVIIITGQ
jgi:hypothetical protein